MQFATATEVDGIRRTLDSFMKQQEDHNHQLNSKFYQVMSYLTKMADKSNTVIVEDASSNINETHPSAPQNFGQVRPTNLHLHKSQFVGDSGSK